jgi:hypothetical protein
MTRLRRWVRRLRARIVHCKKEGRKYLYEINRPVMRNKFLNLSLNGTLFRQLRLLRSKLALFYLKITSKIEAIYTIRFIFRFRTLVFPEGAIETLDGGRGKVVDRKA